MLDDVATFPVALSTGVCHKIPETLRLQSGSNARGILDDSFSCLRARQCQAHGDHENCNCSTVHFCHQTHTPPFLSTVAQSSMFDLIALVIFDAYGNAEIQRESCASREHTDEAHPRYYRLAKLKRQTEKYLENASLARGDLEPLDINWNSSLHAWDLDEERLLRRAEPGRFERRRLSLQRQETIGMKEQGSQVKRGVGETGIPATVIQLVEATLRRKVNKSGFMVTYRRTAACADHHCRAIASTSHGSTGILIIDWQRHHRYSQL
eukprot:6199490-Pleurochrysis_carterae.AAC.5